MDVTKPRDAPSVLLHLLVFSVSKTPDARLGPAHSISAVVLAPAAALLYGAPEIGAQVHKASR